jgi:hypothetical protein
MNGAEYVLGTTLGWIELAERLRQLETELLQVLPLLADVGCDVPAGAARTLDGDAAADVLAACAAIADQAAQIETHAERLTPGSVDVRLPQLQAEAAAALAGGVADVRRALVLARCLGVRTGFAALAAMLRCTDCHEAWGSTTLDEVLGSFRDADRHFVRRVTALATTSPDTTWQSLDREQLGRLASVLERHAATTRCR